jgi:hypothetical protein
MLAAVGHAEEADLFRMRTIYLGTRRLSPIISEPDLPAAAVDEKPTALLMRTKSSASNAIAKKSIFD